MKQFSISFNSKEDSSYSRQNSNPNNLSNYFSEQKNSNLENHTTKNSPLLKPIKKNNSVFINLQYTKSFPLEDQDISQLDLFSDENPILSQDPADNKNVNNQKSNEKAEDELVLKMEEFNGFPSANAKEEFFRNQNLIKKEQQEKEEKKSKLEKINAKKQNMLIEIFNSIDLEGKYQKILFLILALTAFICSMLITSYPLQKELPDFECVQADTFQPNEFKKFNFKVIKDDECIVKYCFSPSGSHNVGHSHEGISDSGAGVSNKFLDVDLPEPLSNQEKLKQAKNTLLLVDYNTKRNFVTVLDIFCDIDFYNKIFTKILFISRIVGILVYGYISDTYGRKVIFSNGLLIILISNLVFFFIKNIYIYILFAFLGNLSLNLIQLITITSVESMSKKYYSTLNGVFNSLFGICGLVNIFVMYKTENWNYILIIHIFCDVIVVSLYYKFVVETPLYSLSTKNFKNFLNDTVYISKLNGVYENNVKEKVNYFISFCKLYDSHAKSQKIILPEIPNKLIGNKQSNCDCKTAKNEGVHKLSADNQSYTSDTKYNINQHKFLHEIKNENKGSVYGENESKVCDCYSGNNDYQKDLKLEDNNVSHKHEKQLKQDNDNSQIIHGNMKNNDMGIKLNNEIIKDNDEEDYLYPNAQYNIEKMNKDFTNIKIKNNGNIKEKFIGKNFDNEPTKIPKKSILKNSFHLNTQDEKTSKAENETNTAAIKNKKKKISFDETVLKIKEANEKDKLNTNNKINKKEKTNNFELHQINNKNINQKEKQEGDTTSRFALYVKKYSVLIAADFKNYFVSIYTRYSKIFKNEDSRKTFFFFLFPYLSVMIGYYGQLMFVEKLPGNIFLNSFLIYFADIISPNIAGYILRFVGRKKVLTIFHCLIIFICLNLPNLSVGVFYTIVLFTNCFLINFINVATDIFAAESFDSSIKSSAMGLLILSGFVSNVFADSLMDFFGTPFYLFAILSAASIASIYNLKEPENYLEE